LRAAIAEGTRRKIEMESFILNEVFAETVMTL